MAFPTVKEVSDPWSFNKDGKSWFGKELVAEMPQLIRK